MPDKHPDQEPVVVNGINASTGRYIDDPTPATVVADLARTREKRRSSAEKKAVAKRQERSEPSFMAEVGVDMTSLEKAGWGVIFAQGGDPQIRQAMGKLLDHRKGQAGDLYREYAGDKGYLAGQTWQQFRTDPQHRVSLGLASPEEMPYYMLLVGSPEQIPYAFQQQLDVERAVGRLDFGNDLAAYERYAWSVVEAEGDKGEVRLPKRAVFFGTENDDDDATKASSQELIGGMIKALAGKPIPGWQVDRIEPKDAKKDRLGRVLGGSETPALLFTATHGAGFNKDDRWPLGSSKAFSRQERHQGALVMQEWPGPLAWTAPLDPDLGHYFSADDLAGGAHLWGLIAVFFACFGAGTPRKSEFFHLKERLKGERLDLADQAFTSPLPQRMLSHANGGALAVVGHVERAWPASFRTPGVIGEEGRDVKAMQQLVSLLMRGLPVGLALEDMNSRYTQFSEQLTQTLYPVLHQNKTYSDEIKRKVAGLWTANNDARNYVILGDPAVHLALSEAAPTPGKHPVLVYTSTVSPGVPPAKGSAEDLSVDSEDATTSTASSVSQQPRSEAAEDLDSLALGLFSRGREGGEPGPLRQFIDKVGEALAQAVQDASELKVSTYVSDDVGAAEYDPKTQTFTGAARKRAMTVMSLDGDLISCIPEVDGKIDEPLWQAHLALVERAQANRAELVRTAVSAVSGLLGFLKVS